jgi:glutamine synthetase
MLSQIRNEEKERVVGDAKERGVAFVDLEFVDIFGMPKMCEITTARLDDVLSDGLWFDGSSIDGFMRIHESDMFLVPDTKTYSVLPWGGGKVARMMCDVYMNEKTPFEGDPRGVLKKNLSGAKEKHGYDFFVGPELEFFIFKSQNGGGVDPKNAQVHDDAGYFDLATKDMAVDLRREIVPALESMGLEIEMSHHEVAPGQHEIDFKYGDALEIADSVLIYKTTVKMLARKYGLHASFMPKPVFGINGSGMHVHQSLWKDNKNAFYDGADQYWLSQTAKHYIAGILHHARALAAVVAPTVNSYKRLVPGYEAPVYVCWGRTNRSALVRIPRSLEGKTAATRAEVRFPDPSCNPYLAFSAMLAAGLDGIEKKMEPPKPIEENLYHFDDRKLKELYIKTLPGSLKEAMGELENDEVVRGALGKHIYEKLTEAQQEQWDGYRLSVSGWEIERYLPVL